MNDSSRHPEVSRIMQILNRKPMVFPVDTQLPGILSTAIQTGVSALAEHAHGIPARTKSCRFKLLQE